MWKWLKNSLLFNVALFILVLLIGAGAYRIVRQAYWVSQEARETEKKIEKLVKKKQELEAYLAELETAEAVRREAKERLNLKLPEETVVVVVPEKKDLPTLPSPNFWERVKLFLGSIIAR